MDFAKSPIIGVIAAVGIVVGGFWAMRGCSRSSETGLRGVVGNQHCLACGYEWHMNTKTMMDQARQDPTGNRFTQCPKCQAWRGVSMGVCAKCGKPIPKVIAHEAPDGTVTTAQRILCDECAAAGGTDPGEEAHEE